MLERKQNELKTRGYVLRRTNYGEADRILNLITPEGKISAMAKGVRKAKSKLAGSVEMFTLAEVNLHFGKTELATLTGAKMIKFQAGILKDFMRMEMAGEILRKISRAAEEIDTPKHFEIVDECLGALSDGCDITLVDAWFLLNLAKSMGEQVNMVTDTDGDELEVGVRYSWDDTEMAFLKNPNGDYSTNAIKTMRLMWAMDIKTVRRVKDLADYAPKVLKIAQAINKVIK